MIFVILLVTAATAVAALGLWGMYLMYVALHAAKRSGKLQQAPKIVQAMSYTLLAVMITADAAFNITFGSLIFLELPRSWMFTSRCSSHLYDPNWRGDIARWVCNGWLNPFEAGHCE